MSGLKQRVLNKFAKRINRKWTWKEWREQIEQPFIADRRYWINKDVFSPRDIERAVDLALKEVIDYKVFYDHIKAHFEKEHPDWEVMCKICNRTFNQIIKEKRLSLAAKKEGEHGSNT